MPVSGLIRLFVMLVLLTVPAWADSTTISGTVSYRERVALPASSYLSISLVALPSGRPVAGASAQIPAQGQPPLAFSLDVHRDLPQGAYGLLAEIRQGDRTLFRNAQPVPVDPASGLETAIMVNTVPQTPTPPLPELPSGLLDRQWTVTSIGGRPVSGDRPVTLTFAADLRASGHSGCNNYIAEASIVGTEMSFGPAAGTRMACAPDLMSQESAYFAALAAIAAFDLDENSLRLLDAAGIPLVGLVPASD